MHVLKSNAKINIGLRILGRRPDDGYHLLETIFQEIDLFDEIIVSKKISTNTEDERFTLSCDYPGVPTDGQNLILKAAKAMIPFLPKDMSLYFELKKQIPIGGGLGGGSSNAACVLNYLNKTANLPAEVLREIAIKLGADVPFFLMGGTAYAQGIGEILTPITMTKNYCVVLVFPGIHISTVWAYEQLRISLTDKPKKAIIPSQLKNAFDWQIFENDFDKAIIPSYPKIGEIKTRLYELGAVYAGLSGSGSTVFGVCESCETAKRAAAAFDSAVITCPV